MSPDRGLFDAVVAASRLNAVIAPFTVSRLLIKAGALPDRLTPDDIRRALPNLEEGLGLYLEAPELAQALHEIRRLSE